MYTVSLQNTNFIIIVKASLVLACNESQDKKNVDNDFSAVSGGCGLVKWDTSEYCSENLPDFNPQKPEGYSVLFILLFLNAWPT